MTAEERRERHRVWAVTWLAYASYYAGRKGFSVAKKTLHDQLGVSEAALGAIDSVYLTTYAFGQFVSGWAGDRIGARRLVGYGMLLSAGALVGFGMSSTALLFLVLFACNGLAQSTGWPGTTRAMAEWTTQGNRGTVMAFWATCYQVGGVAATLLAGWLLSRFGWRSAFFGPALWMALVGLLVLRWVTPGPSVAPSSASNSGTVVEASVVLPDRNVEQRRILKSPLLWCYGASYFFIKFIRYTLLFWLPYYLAMELHYEADDAAYISLAFDAGGIFGVVFLGSLSDRLRRVPRAIAAALSLVLLGVVLLAYSALSVSSLPGVILSLALMGAMLFGPDSLISGAAAQDAGGRQAAAMATGFVNGLGSIGAIVEGLVVPILTREYGWGALFPCLGVLALLAALMLVPAEKYARRS